MASGSVGVLCDDVEVGRGCVSAGTEGGAVWEEVVVEVGRGGCGHGVRD